MRAVVHQPHKLGNRKIWGNRGDDHFDNCASPPPLEIEKSGKCEVVNWTNEQCEFFFCPSLEVEKSGKFKEITEMGSVELFLEIEKSSNYEKIGEMIFVEEVSNTQP